MITDAVEIQKIKNDIAEATMILKSGKNIIGKKMHPDSLEAIRQHVERQIAKLAA